MLIIYGGNVCLFIWDCVSELELIQGWDPFPLHVRKALQSPLWNLTTGFFHQFPQSARNFQNSRLFSQNLEFSSKLKGISKFPPWKSNDFSLLSSRFRTFYCAWSRQIREKSLPYKLFLIWRCRSSVVCGFQIHILNRGMFNSAKVLQGIVWCGFIHQLHLKSLRVLSRH